MRSCPQGVGAFVFRIFLETRLFSICNTVEGVPFFGSLIKRCTWFGMTT